MAPAAIPPLMSSDEVNLLVYSYLAESCLDHSAFTLYSESRLGDFLNSGEENPPAVPPTGQLIRILQKGLLYLQAEAKYRGEDITSNPPRLIGYEIPDTLPLPPLPKSLPPPSPPPVASSSKKRQPPLASSSAATAALANATSSSAINLKRKESSKNGDNSSSNARSASEDIPGQTQAKKQRMAAKSPTASTSDSAMRDAQATSTSSATAENAESSVQTSKEGNSGTEAAALAQSAKSKKGKGKATDTQGGDAEMSGGEGQAGTGSKPVSAAGSANGSDKSSSAVTKTATAPAAAKSALPASTSTTVAPTTSSVKSEGATTSETRRSASPTTTTARKPNGISNLSKDKNRPRSASPNTSLRSVSSSSNFNSARNAASLQTPTIDSSKASTSSSLTQTQEASSKSNTSTITKSAPPPPPPQTGKLEPKHVIKKDEVITLKGHTMPVQPCHWNPQVETLLATGSGDSTMRIWDVPGEVIGSPITSTVVCKHSSGQRRSDVTALEWNVDGSLLASGSEDGIARIWTPSGDLHLVLSMHQRTIFCVKWNNTGSMLLTGSLDHSICLWDTGYGKVKQQWSTHADSILDLDWMTDDIFASCSMDKMINIHQVGRNTPVYRFKGHSDEVNCIRFCPNNRHLASCSDDNTVRVWSLQPVKTTLGLSDKDVQKEGSDENSEPKLPGDEKDKPFVVLRGHDKEVHAVSWCPKVSPDSPKLLASASFDATARIWDALTGACLYIFSRHTDMVYSLAWQPDGNYLATGSNDKKMCVLKVPRAKKASEEKKEAEPEKYELSLEYEHPGPIYEICWHPTRDQIAVCGKWEGVNVVNFDLPSAVKNT